MTGSRRRSRKKWSRQKGIRRGKGLILVLVLIVLAGAGMGGASYYYIQARKQASIQNILPFPSLPAMPG